MPLAEDLNLPEHLLADIKLTPAEEVFLAILREALDPINVHITIEAQPEIPFVLVRRLAGTGDWKGDDRGFIDVARMAVRTYTSGLNGEAAGVALSQIVRHHLFLAWQNHWSDPELGAVVKIKCTSEPTRLADWATSTGPVQYADLPSGMWRHETHYLARIRPPR